MVQTTNEKLDVKPNARKSEKVSPKLESGQNKGQQNDENEETTQTHKYSGPIYYRDPYETDTDQSIDGGDSDLDTEGNIIPGGTRRLTPEKFEEYFANMGDSKENEKDVTAVYYEDGVNVVNEDNECETWLADNGASCHVTNNDICFTNIENGGNDRVIVGDKRRCEVVCKGNLALQSKDNENVLALMNIRMVSAIGKNIISIGALLKEGGTLEGSNEHLNVHYNENI